MANVVKIENTEAAARGIWKEKGFILIAPWPANIAGLIQLAPRESAA